MFLVGHSLAGAAILTVRSLVPAVPGFNKTCKMHSTYHFQLLITVICHTCIVDNPRLYIINISQLFVLVPENFKTFSEFYNDKKFPYISI